MKILVITKPRTRSSFLCSALTNYYNIANKHESFSFVEKQYDELRVRFGLLKQKIELHDIKKYQKLHLEEINRNLKSQDNYVTKLFARDLIFTYNGPIIKDENLFQHEIYLNFNETFKIQDYDTIYFLDRNFIESAISFAFAATTSSFLYLDLSELNYKKKKFKKIYIPNHELNLMDYHIYESVLLLKIKKFLDKENFKYIDLDYDRCTDYVKNNLDCKKPNGYLAGNFNYEEIIENYSSCVERIKNKYLRFTEQLQNLEFVR